MKRIVPVLVLALVMMFGLAACGPRDNGGDPTEPAMPGMPNPMTEVASLADLSEQGSCALVKPTGVNIADESFYIIATDPQIAQYKFTVDGIDCCLRCSNTGIANDISGIYVADGTLFSGQTDTPTVYIENDDLKAQRWVTVDGQYILVANDKGAMDWQTFDNLCSQFMKLEPKNWTSSVPFSAYQAIEGSYDSADGSTVAAVTIVMDHAGLFVIADQADGSRIYWEMEAELQDGKLVYNSETISRIVYDAAAGETKTTALPNGAAGSVTVDPSGKLIFDNPGSPELQGLVLIPRY